MQNDWSLSRYDILPDRIVLYMWSKAGGTKFNFKFRPRYRINAQTPASVVYDYYNPDARATVMPLRFASKVPIAIRRLGFPPWQLFDAIVKSRIYFHRFTRARSGWNELVT